MPSYPTYFCMPAKKKGKKKYSLSISFPIAYDSRSTMLSSGAQKCSFEKSPRRAWRLPTSIFFDADAHFVCLPKESQPPPEWPTHQPANYQGRFPAPAHCWPLCGLAAQLQAREQSQAAPGCRSTQPGLTWLWWHLMREVQGLYAMGKSDIVF